MSYVWHIELCELPTGFVIANQDGILAAADCWFETFEEAEEWLQAHRHELKPMETDGGDWDEVWS